MPVEVSLSEYKRTLESTDGSAQLTIPDGGSAQYTLTHTAGTTGQILTCGTTPTSLEWSHWKPKCIRLSRGSLTGTHAQWSYVLFDVTDVNHGLTYSNNKVNLEANTRYICHVHLRKGPTNQTYSSWRVTDGSTTFARLVLESMDSGTGYSSLAANTAIIDVGASPISVGVQYTGGNDSVIDEGASFTIYEMCTTGGR